MDTKGIPLTIIKEAVEKLQKMGLCVQLADVRWQPNGTFEWELSGIGIVELKGGK